MMLAKNRKTKNKPGVNGALISHAIVVFSIKNASIDLNLASGGYTSNYQNETFVLAALGNGDLR
jgi:hypothetical protein